MKPSWQTMWGSPKGRFSKGPQTIRGTPSVSGARTSGSVLPEMCVSHESDSRRIFADPYWRPASFALSLRYFDAVDRRDALHFSAPIPRCP